MDLVYDLLPSFPFKPRQSALALTPTGCSELERFGKWLWQGSGDRDLTTPQLPPPVTGREELIRGIVKLEPTSQRPLRTFPPASNWRRTPRRLLSTMHTMFYPWSMYDQPPNDPFSVSISTLAPIQARELKMAVPSTNRSQETSLPRCTSGLGS